MQELDKLALHILLMCRLISNGSELKADCCYYGGAKAMHVVIKNAEGVVFNSDLEWRDTKTMEGLLGLLDKLKEIAPAPEVIGENEEA